MKRKGNLYEDICNVNNILAVYDEVCRNTKNKVKVNTYREYKCGNVAKIYNVLTRREYI